VGQESASFEDPLPPDLRLVIVGGERVQTQALKDWRGKAGPTLRWVNTYGPTEASIIATAYEPSSVRKMRGSDPHWPAHREHANLHPGPSSPARADRRRR